MSVHAGQPGGQMLAHHDQQVPCLTRVHRHRQLGRDRYAATAFLQSSCAALRSWTLTNGRYVLGPGRMTCSAGRSGSASSSLARSSAEHYPALASRRRRRRRDPGRRHAAVRTQAPGDSMRVRACCARRPGVSAALGTPAWHVDPAPRGHLGATVAICRFPARVPAAAAWRTHRSGHAGRLKPVGALRRPGRDRGARPRPPRGPPARTATRDHRNRVTAAHLDGH